MVTSGVSLLTSKDRIVSSLMTVLLHSDSSTIFAAFIQKMKSFEQRKYLNAVVAFVTKQYFNRKVEMKEDVPIKPSITVSAAAALIHSLVKDSEILKESLLSALTKSSIPALDDSVFARRSVIAVVAQDEGQYEDPCIRPQLNRYQTNCIVYWNPA